jgi:hypothetical protein
MARGNDSQAAAAEFRGQYGVTGNAENLIEANRAAYPAELRTASLQGLDEEATAKLREDLSKVQSKVEGGTVLDVAVRGKNIIAVVETEAGYTYKQVIPVEEGASASTETKTTTQAKTTTTAPKE